MAKRCEKGRAGIRKATFSASLLISTQRFRVNIPGKFARSHEGMGRCRNNHSSAQKGTYSIFEIAVNQKQIAKCLFPQEKAPCTPLERGCVYSENVPRRGVRHFSGRSETVAKTGFRRETAWKPCPEVRPLRPYILGEGLCLKRFFLCYFISSCP